MSLVHTHHVVRCRLTSKVSPTTIFRKHAIPSSKLTRRHFMTASQDVDALFPLPPARDDVAPSGTAHLFPGRWPGSSIESSRALIDGLKKDYQNFHVFFNDKHFHKLALHFCLLHLRVLPHPYHLLPHMPSSWQSKVLTCRFALQPYYPSSLCTLVSGCRRCADPCSLRNQCRGAAPRIRLAQPNHRQQLDGASR
jgi:hypothetical protein